MLEWDFLFLLAVPESQVLGWRAEQCLLFRAVLLGARQSPSCPALPPPAAWSTGVTGDERETQQAEQEQDCFSNSELMH